MKEVSSGKNEKVFLLHSCYKK